MHGEEKAADGTRCEGGCQVIQGPISVDEAFMEMEIGVQSLSRARVKQRT